MLLLLLSDRDMIVLYYLFYLLLEFFALCFYFTSFNLVAEERILMNTGI